MMLNRDIATKALEAVSSFPVRTYTPKVAKETCKRKTDVFFFESVLKPKLNNHRNPVNPI